MLFWEEAPQVTRGRFDQRSYAAKVAVVEERFVGGVCLNWGCIPTKTVRASAEVGRSLRRAREYGFKAVETVLDMATVVARKQRVVIGLRRSIERLFQARKIDLIEGRGRLIAPGKIEGGA